MKAGDKVVCTNDKFHGIKKDQLIRECEIYTVRWAGTFTHYVDGTFFGVKLAEIDRGADNDSDGFGYDDMPFRADRFRPAVQPKAKRQLEETV
nr:CAP-Gly domain protein [Rhizobium sp. RCAM05973]